MPVIGQTALWWPFGSSLIPAVFDFHHLLLFGKPHEFPNLRRLDPERIDRREARGCVQPAPPKAPVPGENTQGSTETVPLQGLLHVRLAYVPRLCNLQPCRFDRLRVSLRAPRSLCEPGRQHVDLQYASSRRFAPCSWSFRGGTTASTRAPRSRPF